MSDRLNRRDFLKLVGYLPLGLAVSPVAQSFQPSRSLQNHKKNVINIVFDGFSA
jgi:uncharacterized protein (DUF1501 family)